MMACLKMQRCPHTYNKRMLGMMMKLDHIVSHCVSGNDCLYRQGPSVYRVELLALFAKLKSQGHEWILVKVINMYWKLFSSFVENSSGFEGH